METTRFLAYFLTYKTLICLLLKMLLLIMYQLTTLLQSFSILRVTKNQKPLDLKVVTELLPPHYLGGPLKRL